MGLPTTLVTNEVKDASGTEVEFLYFDQEGRARIFVQKNEVPNQMHRLKVSHQESGSGADRVRRSMARIDKYVIGSAGVAVPISIYKVAVVPVGALVTLAEAYNVNAELNTFCATTGASTSILLDGSGNGDSALLTGSL